LSKEAYYFSHDANARHDPKILAMRGEYGMFGYGVYWLIIEMMREQDEYKLPLKKYIYNAIAMQVQCTDFAKDNAKQFVSDCINEFDLFQSDDEHFWSNSLVKRMEKKNTVSEKRKKAAQKRWEKERQNNNSEEEESKSNANAEQNNANAMQNDANKKKGNEIKESKGNEVEERNYTASINNFWDKNGFGANNVNAKHQLFAWLDDKDFKEPGPIILKALEIACANNARKLKFVEGVLREWAQNGCSTMADVEEHQNKRSQPNVNVGSHQKQNENPYTDSQYDGLF